VRPDWRSRLGALASPRRVAGAVLRRGRRLRQVALRRVFPDRRFAWSPGAFEAAMSPRRLACADRPPPAPIIRLLEDRAADRVPHVVASYQEHLLGTYRILATWGQPEDVCGAGLLHSVYSTDSYRHALLSPTERISIRGLLGPYAEALVFLYATVDKADLRRKLSRLSRLPAGLDLVNFWTGQRRWFDAQILGQLLVILVADHADQFCDPGRVPRLWLADYARLLRLSREALDPVPPVFGECTGGLTLAEEQRARDLYLSATAQIAAAPRLAHAHLSECHRLNPWVAEPLVLLAQLELAEGRHADAREKAEAALRLLRGWATAWDKRRSWAAWLAAAEAAANAAAAFTAATLSAGSPIASPGATAQEGRHPAP
jgi:uncharacterized protein DUF6817